MLLPFSSVSGISKDTPVTLTPHPARLTTIAHAMASDDSFFMISFMIFANVLH